MPDLLLKPRRIDVPALAGRACRAGLAGGVQEIVSVTSLIVPVALFALVLVAPAAATPVFSDPPLPPDLATRLNEATAARGMWTALSLLEETRPVSDPGALFVGKRNVVVEAPSEPGYQTIGRPRDAVAAHADNPDSAASATVRVGAFGAIESPPPADDPAAARAQAVRAAAARRVAEVTQAPPGESDAAPRPSASRAGDGASLPAPMPPSVIVPGAGPQRVELQRVDSQGSGSEGIGSQRASSSVPGGPAGGQPEPVTRKPAGSATASAGETAQAAGRPALGEAKPDRQSPPVTPGTALHQPGAAWAGRAGAVGADFIRQLLVRNAEFPDGRALPIRPLFDSFVLSPAVAVQTMEVRDPPPGPAVVTVPMPVYTVPDSIVPGSLRIYGSGAPDVGMLAWWEVWLRDLRSLTGPQIVSILMTTVALVGLVQLWRRRRRIE